MLGKAYIERIPLPVLREAIANAAHRVYEDHLRPVRIEIRPNALPTALGAEEAVGVQRA